MPILGKARKGPRYVHAPFDQLKDAFPDLIFVDGRYRVACVLESARKAAEAHCKATVLLDDYESRPNYHVLEKHLGKPERIGRAASFMIGERSIPEDTVLSHIDNPA